MRLIAILLGTGGLLAARFMPDLGVAVGAIIVGIACCIAEEGGRLKERRGQR